MLIRDCRWRYQHSLPGPCRDDLQTWHCREPLHDLGSRDDFELFPARSLARHLTTVDELGHLIHVWKVLFPSAVDFTRGVGHIAKPPILINFPGLNFSWAKSHARWHDKRNLELIRWEDRQNGIWWDDILLWTFSQIHEAKELRWHCRWPNR